MPRPTDAQGCGADIAPRKAAKRTLRRRNLQHRRLMEVDLAQPRGVCAGVVRALDIDDVPQTTLRLDHTTAIIAALKGRLNDFQRPDIRDICYATQNRQSAVRDLSTFADVIPGVDAARGLTAISCATPAPTPGLRATR